MSLTGKTGKKAPVQSRISIAGISDDRMSDRCHMDAELVGTPCDQIRFRESGQSAGLYRTINSHSPHTAPVRSPNLISGPVLDESGIDPARLPDRTMDSHRISFYDLSVPDKGGQITASLQAPGTEQDPQAGCRRQGKSCRSPLFAAGIRAAIHSWTDQRAQPSERGYPSVSG